MQKKFRFILLAAAALTAGAFTSCNDDDKDNVVETVNIAQAGLSYGEDGVWTDWNKDVDLKIQGFEFSHELTQYNTSIGFVASRSTDNAFHEPMYQYQFTVMPAGGVDGEGTPFLAANWDSYTDGTVTENDDRTCVIEYEGLDGDSPRQFYPQSMMLTNTCYAYYSMLNGDNIAKKFVEGDYLKLIIHGVHADGSESVVDAYLAHCGSVPEEGILKTWKRVDLSELGLCSYIYFTMESSDNGEWGMNTPAYFAIDKFTAILN